MDTPTDNILLLTSSIKEEIGILCAYYEELFNEGKYSMTECSPNKIKFQNRYASLEFFYIKDRYSSLTDMNFSQVMISFQPENELIPIERLIIKKDKKFNLRTFISKNLIDHHIGPKKTYSILIKKYLFTELTSPPVV